MSAEVPFAGVSIGVTGTAPLAAMAPQLAAALRDKSFTGVIQLGADYVLLLQGEAIGAAQIDGGVLRSRQISDLATEGPYQLAASAQELVLGLCASLAGDPVVKGSSALIDVEKLLTNLESSTATGFLILNRDGHFLVARLQDGQLRFVSGSQETDHAAFREQILIYCYEYPVPTLLEVFNDRVLANKVVNRAFADWLDPKAPPPPYYLTCSRHGKIFERRLCKETEVRIGRDTSNDVVIDHRSVSRHHVTVVWDGTRYKAKDQGSVNGTQLNGRQFEMAPLKSGDRLLVGQVEVRFDIVQNTASTGQATLFASEPMSKASKATLIFRGRPKAIELAGFSIGSGDNCDLRVEGWWVKHVQATVVYDDGRYYLRDAGGGPRQVRIGAERVYDKGAVLQDGDVIYVAGQPIVFQEKPRE